MTCGVYAITNKATGEKYIGSAHNIEGRWEEHQYSAKHNMHKTRFDRILDKLGAEAFELEVLQECRPASRVGLEMLYIYMCEPAYNTNRPTLEQVLTANESHLSMKYLMKMGEIALLLAPTATPRQWLEFVRDELSEEYGLDLKLPD